MGFFIDAYQFWKQSPFLYFFLFSYLFTLLIQRKTCHLEPSLFYKKERKYEYVKIIFLHRFFFVLIGVILIHIKTKRVRNRLSKIPDPDPIVKETEYAFNMITFTLTFSLLDN